MMFMEQVSGAVYLKEFPDFLEYVPEHKSFTLVIIKPAMFTNPGYQLY